MSNKAKSAAIIIPHYNDAERLRICLEALFRSPQSDLDRVSIVVCDNASTDDISDLKTDFPTVIFLTQPIKGAAAARNMAVHRTKEPLLFFTDSDCIPDSTWIGTAFAVSGTADLVGGLVETFDETPPPRTGAEAFDTILGFEQQRYVEKMSFSVTANLITSRKIFEQVGDFIVGRSEDLDWCHRARDKGYSIAYSDNLRVLHPTRPTWPELARKWRRMTAEAFETEQNSTIKSFIKALVVGGSGIAHLPKVWMSKRLSFRDKIRGTGTLIRLRLLRMIWLIRLTFGGKIT